MTQKSREKATSVERDFFNLLKNSTFGTDRRNNIDNCILKPVYQDLTDISYVKKFATTFSDNTFRNFFSPALLREEITQTFQSKIFALNKDEPLYEARKKYYENQMEQKVDTVDSFEENKEKPV